MKRALKHALRNDRHAQRQTGLFLVLPLAVFLAGCGEEQIRVYSVPKEAASEPQIAWTLPEGWTEKPAGGFRVGSFSIPGPSGKEVDVSVIPLGGGSGSELDNVNRWREQLGLAPVPAEQLKDLAEAAPIGETESVLYDLAGTDPQTKEPARTLAAILAKDDTTWFFKATGPDALVSQHKPAFQAFLRSVRFESAAAGHALASRSVPAASASLEGPPKTLSRPQWQVPPNWQEQTASSMIVARFSLAEKDHGKAEVTVTAFPGDVGGLLANVNRWRREVGLSPVEEPELAKLVSPIEVNGQPGTLVELAGTSPGAGQSSTRLAVAILPHQGMSWFFKMKGDDALVAKEKPAFLQFVQSVRYGNGS